MPLKRFKTDGGDEGGEADVLQGEGKDPTQGGHENAVTPVEEEQVPPKVYGRMVSGQMVSDQMVEH